MDIVQIFHEQLYGAIQELTSEDLRSEGGSVKLQIAEFQADSVIANRTNNNQAVLCRSHCLSIKKCYSTAMKYLLQILKY